MPFYIIEGDYIGGLYAPKHIQGIDFFIEKACFLSGAVGGAIFFRGFGFDFELWEI